MSGLHKSISKIVVESCYDVARAASVFSTVAFRVVGIIGLRKMVLNFN